jgi:LmbE family N-acetylglucosaminyl deacetylase
VVIAVATDGVIGPVTGPGAQARLAELRASAAVLGAARVVHLGYADSGYGRLLYPDPPDRQRFARADPAEAAARLAGLIRGEQAGLLLSYDPRGGYGHRDHVKVHEVGARAAQLTGVRVWEATLPRELVVAVGSLMRLLGLVGGDHWDEIRAGFTPRSAITHPVDVRRFARQKQAALAAHRSFAHGPRRSARLARAMVALPVPLFGLFFGREWFTEPAQPRPRQSAEHAKRRPSPARPVIEGSRASHQHAQDAQLGIDQPLKVSCRRHHAIGGSVRCWPRALPITHRDLYDPITR